MKKLIITALTMSALIVATPALARTSCKSFKTQKEAQAWHDKRKRNGQKGWKSLDRDKDGEACECLPGGSAYGSGKCRR